MGGQTALNVGIELWKAGVFEKYNCKVSILLYFNSYIYISYFNFSKKKK